MRQNWKLVAWASLGFIGGAKACPHHVASNHHAAHLNERQSPPSEQTRTAIKDVRVFDGWSFTLPRTVCMDAGYITDTNGCDGAQTTIDGTGKFLLPGLMDSHVHLSDVQSLENFTSYGCTTAFHMDCENFTQCGIMANQSGLASFIYAGMAAIGNDSQHELENPTRAKNTLIYPDTNVTAYVEYQFGNGSDFSKIVAEVNGPSLQQQIDMIQTTHDRYSKQIMTHASDVMSYHQAVESRTDGIQHVPDDGLLDNATIHKILAQKQFVTPTINIFEYAYNSTLLEGFLGVEPNSNRTLAHAQANARSLYIAGVPLLAGTDAVGSITLNGSTASVPFGLTVHQELENLVNIAGMSPAEAINAATRVPAKWHRVQDRGTVEIGKRADLLMLNSNPLDQIQNTQDIDRVWVFGREVSQVTKLQ